VLTLALRAADENCLAPFAQALGRGRCGLCLPLLVGDTVSTLGPLTISTPRSAGCLRSTGPSLDRPRRRSSDVSGTIATPLSASRF